MQQLIKSGGGKKKRESQACKFSYASAALLQLK